MPVGAEAVAVGIGRIGLVAELALGECDDPGALRRQLRPRAATEQNCRHDDRDDYGYGEREAPVSEPASSLEGTARVGPAGPLATAGRRWPAHLNSYAVNLSVGVTLEVGPRERPGEGTTSAVLRPASVAGFHPRVRLLNIGLTPEDPTTRYDCGVLNERASSPRLWTARSRDGSPPEVSSEPVEVGVAETPNDDFDLADDVGGGQGSPGSAVKRVAPAVTHHEIVVGRDPRRRDVLGGLDARPGEDRQPWLLEGLPVDEHCAPD